MVTWLMGAWLLYHAVALFNVYGEHGTPASGLEDVLHQHLTVIDLGAVVGASGPTFVITYGVLITFAILITLYLEMSRTVRYGLDRNFKSSPSDLYGSILLLIVTSIELFFAPIAWTSVFIILFFACIMDVLLHVRYLHHFVSPRRA